MNNEVYEELKKLINCFPDAYINRRLEFVLISKTNTYFHLEGCLTREDVISKVLMWCTRDIANAAPYVQTKRNIGFYVKNKECLEKYLGASVNVDVIYQCFGNGINPTLTKEFINSGFSMNLLFSEVDDEND
nr:MAG TPA: hypothetical protein [Caudoviricetes sp.]